MEFSYGVDFNGHISDLTNNRTWDCGLSMYFDVWLRSSIHNTEENLWVGMLAGAQWVSCSKRFAQTVIDFYFPGAQLYIKFGEKLTLWV